MDLSMSAANFVCIFFNYYDPLKNLNLKNVEQGQKQSSAVT